jgi:uncharacterized membrane protein
MQVLCVIPYDIARWIFVGIAFALTGKKGTGKKVVSSPVLCCIGYFLVKNLYTVISRTDAKTSRILLLVILAAHAIFALVLKVAFYSYSYVSPVDPPPSQ